MFGIGIPTEALEKILVLATCWSRSNISIFPYGCFLARRCSAGPNGRSRVQLDSQGVRHLRVISGAVAVTATGEPLPPEQISLAPGDAVAFRGPDCTLSVSDSANKALLLELAAANPQSLPFDELVARAGQRLRDRGMGSTDDPPLDEPALTKKLAAIVVEWFATRLVDLQAFEPPLAVCPGERPIASAVARYQLTHGGASGLNRRTDARAGLGPQKRCAATEGGPTKGDHQVINLLHRRVRLGGDLAGIVLLRLDGRHDRAAIIAELAQPVLEGRAKIRIDDQAVTDPYGKFIGCDRTRRDLLVAFRAECSAAR